MLPSKTMIEKSMRWAPSAAKYGAVGTCMLLYFTEWRLILDYVPFYNGKFKQDI